MLTHNMLTQCYVILGLLKPQPEFLNVVVLFLFSYTEWFLAFCDLDFLLLISLLIYGVNDKFSQSF